MPHISRGVAAATLAFSAYGARSVSRHGLKTIQPIASQTYPPQFHKQVLSFVCSVVGSLVKFFRFFGRSLSKFKFS